MSEKKISLELVDEEDKKEKEDNSANDYSKKELPKKPRGVLLKEARRAWNELAPVLHDMGALEKVDFPSFVMMMEHYALAVRAAKKIREDGLFREDENGVERKHPATQVLRDNSQQYRQYIREFAVSPRARELLNLDHYFEDKERSAEDVLNGDVEFEDI